MAKVALAQCSHAMPWTSHQDPQTDLFGQTLRQISGGRSQARDKSQAYDAIEMHITNCDNSIRINLD